MMCVAGSLLIMFGFTAVLFPPVGDFLRRVWRGSLGTPWNLLLGLVLPLLLLPIWTPGPLSWRFQALPQVAVAVLAGWWGLRLLGRGLPDPHRTRLVLGSSLAVLVAVEVVSWDWLLGPQERNPDDYLGDHELLPYFLLMATCAGFLTLAPLRRALDFRTRLATVGLEASGFFSDAAERWWAAWGLVALGPALVLAHLTYTPDSLEQRLLHLRPEIQAAARNSGADPALMAALVATLESRPARPLVSLWRKEPDWVSPEAARMVHAVLHVPPKENSSELWAIGGQWQWFNRQPGALRLRGALPGTPAEVLSSTQGSLHYMGLLLALHSALWDAEPQCAIRHRPEVLASLYAREPYLSRPGPNPKVSDFGREVLEAYRSPFIQTHFGAPPRP